MTQQIKPGVSFVSTPASAKPGIGQPEGKRMVSVIIDWTQIPFTTWEDNQPTFPEWADGDFWMWPYQYVEIDLGDLLYNQIPLSEVKSMIYNWRQAFASSVGAGGTPPEDDAGLDAGYDLFGTALSVPPMVVTNTQTQQSVFIGPDGFPVALEPGGATAIVPLVIRVDGAVPFYGVDRTVVRFLRVDPTYTNLGAGKGVFTFCNFEVPPYSKTSYGVFYIATVPQ